MTDPPVRAVVTVGMFDGVHRAHQQLIRSTVRLAKRWRGTSVVVTFDPDPQTVLQPIQAAPALMPLEARIRCLHASGVDWVWVIPFTRAFSRITAETFVRRMLLHRLRAVALVVGETFVFGKDRRGDMTLLRSLGRRLGMRVISVRPIVQGGIPVSSSRIRRLLSEGQLARARRLLGRPPTLYGRVVRGVGRGRRLGIPTANLELIPQVLPPQGVYAVIVSDGGTARRARPPGPSGAGGAREWRAGGVMNLGRRPTFGFGPLVCEVHLLRFSGSLHHRVLTVSLLARLRGERCFPNPAALVRQVRRDIARARQLFTRPALR